jgi:hypothetical protein
MEAVSEKLMNKILSLKSSFKENTSGGFEYKDNDTYVLIYKKNIGMNTRYFMTLRRPAGERNFTGTVVHTLYKKLYSSAPSRGRGRPKVVVEDYDDSTIEMLITKIRSL